MATAIVLLTIEWIDRGGFRARVIWLGLGYWSIMTSNRGVYIGLGVGLGLASVHCFGLPA